MNIIYELLAKLANVDKIKCGQEIIVNVDLALAHDGSMLKLIEEVKNLPYNQKITHTDKLYVAVDHFIPAPNIKSRENYRIIKSFCQKHRIRLYDNGEGILHQIVDEEFKGMLKNKIVVGIDGHMCTLAGLGAIPFSITPKEMITVLITGRYNLIVPKVLIIELVKEFNRNTKNKTRITGKDISLFLLKEIGISKLKGNAILLYGNVLKQLNQSQRMTIGNIFGEIGARTVYFLEEGKIDEGGYAFKINDIKPSVALPGSVGNVLNLEEVKETEISQVYIGGCTNGRLDDMEQVAEILFNKKIHSDVTLVVCPASRKVANGMDKLGYSQIIRNSGGIIINPGCGACSGIHQGVISKDDVVVTTTPRNTPGRMGDKKGQIYIVSPITASIIALEGKIKPYDFS